MIAQYEQYVRDYQRGAFAMHAPTSVVRDLTGREPESFEAIARRYATSPEAKRALRQQLSLMLRSTLWILRSAPKTTPLLALRDFTDTKHPSLSADSAEWRHEHAASLKAALAGD